MKVILSERHRKMEFGCSLGLIHFHLKSVRDRQHLTILELLGVCEIAEQAKFRVFTFLGIKS